MELYRITREKYASRLEASGRSNRWNKEKQHVIYASSSRSLATLELVAHRNAIMEGLVYKTVIIKVPNKNTFIVDINLATLPKDWNLMKNRILTQNMGSDWYENMQSAVLKVPSAIIKEEYNYIINTMHPDFSKVKIDNIEDFIWDKRLL